MRVCASVLVLGAVLIGAAIAENAPADNLLPYLNKCCALGQEFARSRDRCDESLITLAHNEQVPMTAHDGVSNITCTIAATQCCEDTLSSEIHCGWGIKAAQDYATCSQQTNPDSKTCCTWCRAALEGNFDQCDGLPKHVPPMARNAYSICCNRLNTFGKKCGKPDCDEKNHTCVGQRERCVYDGVGCHYKCLEQNTCPRGFEYGPDGRCQDIDECARKNSCNANEICVNTYGGYDCKKCPCDLE